MVFVCLYSIKRDYNSGHIFLYILRFINAIEIDVHKMFQNDLSR